MVSNYVISSMSAGGLAPLGDMASAGTVMTKFSNLVVTVAVDFSQSLRKWYDVIGWQIYDLTKLDIFLQSSLHHMQF